MWCVEAGIAICRPNAGCATSFGTSGMEARLIAVVVIDRGAHGAIAGKRSHPRAVPSDRAIDSASS
jgi:hypothetical protein